MNKEKFANALSPAAALLNDISAVATACNVTNPGNFPALGVGEQFTMSIQDSVTSIVEIVTVTATAGASFTIARGQEGSIAAAHAASSVCINGLTKGIMQRLQPSGEVQIASGNFAWPLDADGHPLKTLVLNQTVAGAATISLDPTLFTAFQTYRFVDGARIANVFALILSAISGNILNSPLPTSYQLQGAGEAVGFSTDGANFWLE